MATRQTRRKRGREKNLKREAAAKMGALPPIPIQQVQKWGGCQSPPPKATYTTCDSSGCGLCIALGLICIGLAIGLAKVLVKILE